jgi:hypothetical protein
MVHLNEKYITAAATILVPIILGFAGNCITNKIAERDLALRYIQIATDVLKTEKNPAVRDWAVDVINCYSKVKMSGAVKQALNGSGSSIEQEPDKSSGQGNVR